MNEYSDKRNIPADLKPTYDQDEKHLLSNEYESISIRDKMANNVEKSSTEKNKHMESLMLLLGFAKGMLDVAIFVLIWIFYTFTIYLLLIERIFNTYKRFSLGHTYLLQNFNVDLYKLFEATILSLLATIGHISYIQQSAQINYGMCMLTELQKSVNNMNKFLNILMVPYICKFVGYWLLNVFNIMLQLRELITNKDTHIPPYLSIFVCLFVYVCQANFIANISRIFIQKMKNIVKIEIFLEESNQQCMHTDLLKYLVEDAKL